MPPYDPRANRPAPAASSTDAPAAVDALLEKTETTDAAPETSDTIDLRDNASVPSTPPAARPPEPAPPVARGVAVALAVVVVVAIVWTMLRRQRHRG